MRGVTAAVRRVLDDRRRGGRRLDVRAGAGCAGWRAHGVDRRLLAVLGPPPARAAAREAARDSRADAVARDVAAARMDGRSRGTTSPRRRAGCWSSRRGIAPDIVHLNGYAHAALPFDAPGWSCAAHSCVRSWWRAVHGDERCRPTWDGYARGGRARAAARRLRGRADAAMLRALVDATTALHAPIAVIHNGRPPLTRAAPREARRVVLAAGRLWDEAKNIAALDRAAARLSRACRWPVLRRGRPRARRRRRRDCPGMCGCSAARRGARWRDAYARGLDLRAAGALRAVRAGGARSGAGGLRAGARRHPEPARALGRRRAVRRPERRRRAGRRAARWSPIRRRGPQLGARARARAERYPLAQTWRGDAGCSPPSGSAATARRPAEAAA